ncbi:hypothetical protein AVEN_149454-1 [Araneus ventricosus]|uniref:Uncharacterized protein n=1 Tax=Araneus ventricosus TaxID=182803 RepID=A0A4Y2JDM1_ARAVE|nr:hypothetical protein AVEN_149454-1 [Araneus ventricosus]
MERPDAFLRPHCECSEKAKLLPTLGSRNEASKFGNLPFGGGGDGWEGTFRCLAEMFNPCHGNLYDNTLPLLTPRFPKPFRQAFFAIWEMAQPIVLVNAQL